MALVRRDKNDLSGLARFLDPAEFRNKQGGRTSGFQTKIPRNTEEYCRYKKEHEVPPWNGDSLWVYNDKKVRAVVCMLVPGFSLDSYGEVRTKGVIYTRIIYGYWRENLSVSLLAAWVNRSRQVRISRKMYRRRRKRGLPATAKYRYGEVHYTRPVYGRDVADIIEQIKRVLAGKRRDGKPHSHGKRGPKPKVALQERVAA